MIYYSNSNLWASCCIFRYDPSSSKFSSSSRCCGHFCGFSFSFDFLFPRCPFILPFIFFRDSSWLSFFLGCFYPSTFFLNAFCSPSSDFFKGIGLLFFWGMLFYSTFFTPPLLFETFGRLVSPILGLLEFLNSFLLLWDLDLDFDRELYFSFEFYFDRELDLESGLLLGWKNFLFSIDLEFLFLVDFLFMLRESPWARSWFLFSGVNASFKRDLLFLRPRSVLFWASSLIVFFFFFCLSVSMLTLGLEGWGFGSLLI